MQPNTPESWAFPLTQLVLAAACLLPANSLAEESLTEADFFSEIPVVLSGTRLHQSLHDSPAAITVLDREMIEASGAREVYELLRLVPGFQVGSPSGHTHSVTSHGLSDQFSRRMQVLVDGRSAYNLAIGGVEWTDLPLAVDDIERIEVIRGPNAATHGSNSFLGVISIITQHPSVVPNHTVRVSKGNNGIEDALYRHGSSGERLDYRLTLGYMADDGFDTRHDSKTVRMANLQADYQLNLQDRLEVQLGYSEGPREEGFPNDRIWESDTTDKRNHFEQIRWRRVESSEDEWSLQFSHNYEKRIETRSGTGIVPVNANGSPERYDLELYRTRQHSKALRWVWGLGARRDEFTSEIFLGEDDTRSNDTFRVFGNLEWRLAAPLLINLGAMWEHTDISGTTLSPRLALNYRLRPTQTLRVAASQAYRTPVFFEQDADFSVQMLPPPEAPPGTPPMDVQIFQGSGDLDPERIRSWEIGYIGEFPAADLTLDLRLFHDSLDDLITQVDDPASPPPTETFINDQEATARGLEAQLQWRPAPGNLLVVGYAWTDVDSDSSDLEDSAPRHTLSLLGSHRFNERFSGSAAWYYVDEQQWLGSGDKIPAYDRVDLRLAYTFRLGGKSAELSGVVQNPFGDYRDFRYSETNPQKRNVFDTRGWLSLRVDF
jgi:iron complex outermembrane receptor protein